MKFILTGDNHHTNRTPICREDDYVETQRRKIQFINEQCVKYDAVHLCAGDIVNKAKGKTASDALDTLSIVDDYGEFYGIVGNHDEPNKLLDKIEEGIIGNLMRSETFHLITDPLIFGDNVIVYGFNYGQDIKHTNKRESKDKYVKIALFHGYVTNDPNANINGLYAPDIVEKFKDDYHFIITADNHTPFTVETEGCTLINVGSLMRTTIEQIDYEPHIYLLDTDTLSYTAIPVPIVSDVISTEHKDKATYKADTMDSVVEVIHSNEDVTLSFEHDLALTKEENHEVINDNVLHYIDVALGLEEEDVA